MARSNHGLSVVRPTLFVKISSKEPAVLVLLQRLNARNEVTACKSFLVAAAKVLFDYLVRDWDKRLMRTFPISWSFAQNS